MRPVDPIMTAADRSSHARFGEPAKFLPVIFVWLIIVGLYAIYMLFHCLPKLHDASKSSPLAIIELAVFNVTTLLLVVCYMRCILVHPGSIPDNLGWEYVAPDSRGTSTETVSVLYREEGTEAQMAFTQLREQKRSGERRHCKWCAKYKPDRCHHCRVCRMCILKMDHHCPWIYNCVGFANHKYFFLLLFYTAIDTHLIFWTMLTSVRHSVDVATPFHKMFLLLFGETLAGFMGALVTIFLGFHIWLAIKSMTTIEFCEKSMKRSSYDTSTYNRGALGNMKAALGENVLLWLCPWAPPNGDGLAFTSEDTHLSKDVEIGSRSHSRPEDSYGASLKSKTPPSGGPAFSGIREASDSGTSEPEAAEAAQEERLTDTTQGRRRESAPSPTIPVPPPEAFEVGH